MNLENDYPLVLRQDVLWGDMDAFGHVNNTVYFRYFEDARIAYFKAAGIGPLINEASAGPILANTQCQFRLPLDFPDRIHIGARSEILSARKFNMEYAVYSEQHDSLCAEGSGLVVYYDYSAGRSCEIPGSIVAAIEKLEQGR